MSADTALLALPFLQRWDGSSLSVNLLLVPRKSPFDALVSSSPPFATANFKFNVHIQSGTDQLPLTSTPATHLSSVPAISSASQVFRALDGYFTVDPLAKKAYRGPHNRVRKFAPLSYRNAARTGPVRTDLLVTDKQYSCAFTYKRDGYKPIPPNPLMSWGKIYAILLRNAALAKAAGLIRALNGIPISDPETLKEGGYLWVSLHPDSDASGLNDVPGGFQTFATRIPELPTARELFSPVLLPVLSQPPSLDYGQIFSELEDYDDGWAKAVHCYQSQNIDPLSEVKDGTRPVKEMGILIGWDDEQITVWMDRQLGDSPQTGFNSPLGVAGYRVDVRLQGEAEWQSLTRASGTLSVPGVELGQFNDELHVEIHPNNPNNEVTGEFWLPMYMCTWMGISLVSLDPDRQKLAGVIDPSIPAITGIKPAISLLYGKNYEFRVRFMDQTGGGPSISGSPNVPGPSPVGAIAFRRWIKPLRPQVVDDVEDEVGEADPNNPPSRLTISRPLLHSAALLCTGAYPDAMARLLADIPKAKAEGREPGLPDPDVERVKITVEVSALRGDPAALDGLFMPVFETERRFPSDLGKPLFLDLKWDDYASVTSIPNPSDGPLNVPTARFIRLRMVSVCREDPQGDPDQGLDYFGEQDVRSSLATELNIKKHSIKESQMFVPSAPSRRLCALFLQPDQPVDKVTSDVQGSAGSPKERPSDIASRLAAELDLRNDGLTLRARPGRRVVWACSSSVQYVLGPDRASITFSSQTDIALRWLTVIRLTINRDWTWDGLNEIQFSKDSTVIDRLSLPRDINDDALRLTSRDQTDLIFLDAVDPKPKNGELPREIDLNYTVNWSCNGDPPTDEPLKFSLKVPVTTRPTQVPSIVSAGIAFSPYKRAMDYSTSDTRQRALWIELAEPVRDDRDAYFARVLQYAPDPVLTDQPLLQPSLPESHLPIDPESVRKIVQNQSDDSAGLHAMQRLIPSDSPLHWSLPLPPGMADDSPELFGLFTYELRVGHSKNIWSTAQGRFGPPLRVAGIQHPAPSLLASVLRTSSAIKVSAPFATPIYNGRMFLPKNLASEIHVLLYAQARRMDGADAHNVLISVKPAVYYGVTAVPLPPFGEAEFALEKDVFPMLTALGFGRKAPLSVLAVEMMPQGQRIPDSLTAHLGIQRILRTGNLLQVPGTCP